MYATIYSQELDVDNSNILTIAKLDLALFTYELYFKIYLTYVDYPENDIWSYIVEITEEYNPDFLTGKPGLE